MSARSGTAQWLWIEHPTFRLRAGHSTTELLLPLVVLLSTVFLVVGIFLLQKVIQYYRQAISKDEFVLQNKNIY